VRQLRDVKITPLVETYDAEMLAIYGKMCGWVLARACQDRRPVGDCRLSGKERSVWWGDGQIRARI